LGCVSNYGSSEAREDFVEVIANYIVKPDDWWQNMLKEAGTDGAAIINQKWEICNTWLKEKWEIDLNALRAEVQERQKNLDWNMIMNLEFLNGK
jgi:substrate import-associated zinc metallohydrolase lipoprotein